MHSILCSNHFGGGSLKGRLIKSNLLRVLSFGRLPLLGQVGLATCSLDLLSSGDEPDHERSSSIARGIYGNTI